MMKLGCHVSALKNPRQAPYEEAVENAGRLGFEGVELIAMTRGELDDYYKPERIRALRSLAAEHKLTISQFAIYSTACEGMASLDRNERDEGIEVFLQGIKVCRDLGCELVNLVAHWPIGLQAPIDYPPSYIYPIVRGVNRIASPKVVMQLPEPFDFAAIWENYVESLTTVATLAEEHGVRLALEGHAHVIVSGADAMLRLFDQAKNPNIVVNFDTSWHFIQREYLPMSIHKLAGKIAHVHCRDADGLLFYGLPPGQGVIDWHGVVRALAATGFDGFLSFEFSGYEDNLRIAADAKAYMERVLSDVVGG
jgi:sugar phosphate isomerase/epimerase